MDAVRRSCQRTLQGAVHTKDLPVRDDQGRRLVTEPLIGTFYNLARGSFSELSEEEGEIPKDTRAATIRVVRGSDQSTRGGRWDSDKGPSAQQLVSALVHGLSSCNKQTGQ